MFECECTCMCFCGGLRVHMCVWAVCGSASAHVSVEGEAPHSVATAVSRTLVPEWGPGAVPQGPLGGCSPAGLGRWPHPGRLGHVA